MNLQIFGKLKLEEVLKLHEKHYETCISIEDPNSKRLIAINKKNFKYIDKLALVGFFAFCLSAVLTITRSSIRLF